MVVQADGLSRIVSTAPSECVDCKDSGGILARLYLNRICSIVRAFDLCSQM